LIDLSKAPKLKEVAFTLDAFSVTWVAAILRTITSENGDLQEVSFKGVAFYHNIDMPADVRTHVGDESYREWMDLDCVLVQLWQLHAVHVKIVFNFVREELSWKLIGGLLPETTKREVAIVESAGDWEDSDSEVCE
jgi:hypothetical protein